MSTRHSGKPSPRTNYRAHTRPMSTAESLGQLTRYEKWDVTTFDYLMYFKKTEQVS